MSDDGLLVWIDLETTGLDPKIDAILEIACVVTDGDLRDRAAAFSVVTNAARDRAFSSLPARVQEMHGSSGLWSESLASRFSEVNAGVALLEYLRIHVPPGARPELAGSSVHFDRMFLHEHMPAVLEPLHYRHLDVSSVREAVRRFWPAVHNAEPLHVVPAQRALADVRAAVELLAFYRRALQPYTPPAGAIAGAIRTGRLGGDE